MTLVDLYARTLERLEITEAGESAAPEDTKIIRDKYPLVYEMLLSLGLVAWGKEADVPDFAVLPLVSMLAFVSAREFGKDQAIYADGMLGANPPQVAERQLRQQLSRAYIPYVAESEYF